MNILLYCCDQMRSDFAGAFGENSMSQTPVLNRMIQRGSSFRYAVTNQPLCSPSRACMITGRYATETGEWKIGTGMRTDLPTLASVLTENGYTANFIGKWHLMRADRKQGIGVGWVPPNLRHGFDGLWEGANEFEWTTHPYEGTIWDNAGKPISYKDQYRVDFITGRAVKFLRQPHDKPFLLYVSQLEPHQQNDLHRVVAPEGYAERYTNPQVPADCRNLPGDWQQQLPDYYGCVQKIDESVGTLLKTLEEQGLADNTIVCFISDHGCHFETRNTEYKRSPHDASIRFPFIMNGPGLDRGLVRDEIVTMIDLTPLRGIPDVQPLRRSQRAGEPGGSQGIPRQGRRAAREVAGDVGRGGRGCARDRAGNTVSVKSKGGAATCRPRCPLSTSPGR
jgi:arylsulfatase A-like enzyme